MKRFRCGDVVPGCAARFEGSEGQILALVGAHASDDHGMTEISPELVQAVRAAMRPV